MIAAANNCGSRFAGPCEKLAASGWQGSETYLCLVMKAVEAGTAAVSSASEQIAEWAKRIGKKKAVEMLNAEPEDINDKLEDFCRPEVEDVFKQWEKAKRSEQLKQLWERIKSQFSLKEGEDLEDNQGQYEEFHLKKAFKVIFVERALLITTNLTYFTGEGSGP